MTRPKIDQKVKEARFRAAQGAARKLNKKLPRPHVYAYATEAGRVVIYYEPPNLPKVRLRAAYPSPEFDIELAAAKRGPTGSGTARKRVLPAALPSSLTSERTFGHLIGRYQREDKLWATYADKPRRLADFEDMVRARINPDSTLVFGDLPLEFFDTGSVQTLMDLKLKQKTVVDPVTGKERVIWTNTEAANQRRKWLSAVLQFGVERKLIQFNYVQSVRRAKKDHQGRSDEDDGFPTWSEAAIEAYRNFHRLGTLARLVFGLTLYTTARKSDLPRLGRHLVRKDRQGRDTLVYVQHKNRNAKPITVYQPIWPELRDVLDASGDAGMLGQLLYLVQKPGRTGERGYSPDTLGNYMQDWVDDALNAAALAHPSGPKGFSLHGLRKAGICSLILKGVPDRWIMAISGHRDPREIDRYGRRYMREFGAEGAFDIWLGGQSQRAIFNETEFEKQFIA